MKHCPACNAEIANDLKNCGRHGVSTDEPLPQVAVGTERRQEQAETRTGLPLNVLSSRDTRQLSYEEKLKQASNAARAEREKAGV